MKIKLPNLPDKLEIITSNQKMNWHESKNWCMSQGGELPTKFELQALVESGQIPERMQYEWYWSNSIQFDTYQPTSAFCVYLQDGGTDLMDKSVKFSVLCIKDL